MKIDLHWLQGLQFKLWVFEAEVELNGSNSRSQQRQLHLKKSITNDCLLLSLKKFFLQCLFKSLAKKIEEEDGWLLEDYIVTMDFDDVIMKKN